MQPRGQFLSRKHPQSALIIADGAFPEILTLLEGAELPAHVIQPHENPLQRIGALLSTGNTDTLHIVAHGKRGAFRLGDRWIDENTLLQEAHTVSQWKVASIALWSCAVGAGSALVSLLARLTGARVTASNENLGMTAAGPQWSLGAGAMAIAAPFAAATLQSWPHQLAEMTFVGAYKVTNTADKETNSHTFDYSLPLGSASVDDDSASLLFSGNDVSAIGINIGGQTYYGWISRPIKAQGVVRGFYMWTDAQFTNLALAQADGNQDGDSNPGDNQGFILVVDQAWFDAQAFTGGSTKTVGSSSDRVDAALNALIPANVAPVAVADISNTGLAAGASGGPAQEQGASVATVNAIGNVLGNDSDSNVGDTLAVSKAGTSLPSLAVNSSTTSTNGTGVTGKYGTLTIGSDGSYSYVVNNSNSAVQALRTASNTLSDVFRYTVSDTSGATSTTTLTIQIKGANDAPVGSNDYNSAKESITGYVGYSAQGNVLRNDTDVDANGETLTVGGITGSANVSNVNNTAPSSVLTFIGDSGFNSVSIGQQIGVLIGGTYRAVLTSGGAAITVSGKTEVTSNNWDITLNATPAFYYDAGGNVAISNIATFFSTNSAVGFRSGSSTTTVPSNSMKTATVATAETAGTATVDLSSVTLSGAIAVGMSVSGTGIPADTHITSITYDINGKPASVLLDNNISSTNGTTLTFSGSAGQTVTGRHGTLVLNANGSYVYTPTANNANLTAGQSAVEEFKYSAIDASGATTSASLFITVYGTGTNDPLLTADTSTALETGVAAGSNGSGNVLTNDLEKTGAAGPVSNIVAGARAADAVSETAVTTNTAITGLYGMLTISASGAYTYTPDNANPTVNALASGSSLTETFYYRVTNSLSGSSAVVSSLTVTLNGANDTPVAVSDSDIAQEDVLNAAGNVISNDSDVDTSDTLSIVKAQAGTSTSFGAEDTVTTGTTSANGLSITGSYGTLVLGANGSYTYTVNNASASVQALDPADTPLTDTFVYQLADAGNALTTATLTMSVSGTNDIPANTAPAAVNVAKNGAFLFTGGNAVSVADPDDNISSVSVSVENGTLSVSLVGGATINSGASGSAIFTMSGTRAQLNAALATLSYSPTSNFTGTDYLTIYAEDDYSAFDNDVVTLNVAELKDLQLGAISGNTTEAGGTATFTVQLTAQPTQDVTVTLASNDTSEGTVSATPLTFTSANWNTPQTVTVTGVDDAVVDGDIAYKINLSTASTDADYQGKTGEMSVTNSDDDSASLVVGSISGNTSEAGGTATFTVKLHSQPTQDVTVSVATSDSTEGTPNSTTLTFTSANWNSNQTVTVTGVDDAMVDGSIGYKMNLTSASSDANYQGKSGEVSITNTDNDSAALVVSTISANTTEGGGTGTFTIKLSSQPASDVTITVASNDSTEGTASPTTLTFTSGNWNSNQTVTVTGVDDALIDGNINYAVDISAASSDGSYQGKTASVSVVNTDNDGAQLVLGSISGNTTEAGGTATFTIKLSSQPTQDVTVSVVSNDTTEGTASPTTLTFTSANWNSNQTVTVTGVDDPQVDGNIAYQVNASASSGDTNYQGKTGSVAVTNQDNDVAVTGALVVGAISGNTTEAGGSASFSVKLNTQPLQNVTVTVTSNDTTEGTVSPVTLTFTSANWNSNQTVTVTGVDDPAVDGNINYAVNLASASSDNNFQGKSGSVNVVNVDNDVALPPDPVPQPLPPFGAILDPGTDNGPSNQDRITSNITPEFTISGGSALVAGFTAVLRDPSGQLMGSAQITPADVSSGKVNVPALQLDDGVYTFMAQIIDDSGLVRAQAPVTVTIITDRDGVAPSIELAANGGDFNKDGIADWDQNNLAHLPLTSLAAFAAGKNAPQSSFGAIMVGSLVNAGANVQLDSGAQLLDVKLQAIDVALPQNLKAASDPLQFSVTSLQNGALLDVAPGVAGLQTRVIIDLPQGVRANTYIKLDDKGQWIEFLDDQNLATFDDGATLIDRDGDGLIDRVVLTITDGGAGDEDGLANGTIVDPGMLALRDEATPVYSVLLANGDRFYTVNAGEAATMARGNGNVFEGVRFDALSTAQGGRQIFANHNFITDDWYFAADGQAMPYACYERIDTMAGFTAAAAGSGPGSNFHLFLNAQGITQLVTQAEAQQLGLGNQGFRDMGAIFNTTSNSAFRFDAEGYLIANRSIAAVQQFVAQLASQYRSSSDAGFVDAVEQHYLTQVVLVGVAHGDAASAADLNASFGTAFQG